MGQLLVSKNDTPLWLERSVFHHSKSLRIHRGIRFWIFQLPEKDVSKFHSCLIKTRPRRTIWEQCPKNPDNDCRSVKLIELLASTLRVCWIALSSFLDGNRATNSIVSISIPKTMTLVPQEFLDSLREMPSISVILLYDLSSASMFQPNGKTKTKSSK